LSESEVALSGSEIGFSSRSRRALTDKTGVYLIEAYRNIARVAWSSTAEIASEDRAGGSPDAVQQRE
jgi:hypothetical protein